MYVRTLDPDKRSYFDEGTSQEAFNTFDDYMRYGQRNENNFYQGNKLITALTESMWERRVGSGNTVWLVEYYAPWCGHCQQMVPTFSNIASMLEEEEAIEVGAVNCATQSVICNEWFGIRSYPTVVALNDHHGMRQEYDGPLEPLEVTTWLKRVAREWRWLMRQSRHLISLVSEQAFKEQVLESNEFWIVVFLDGFDCSACQTAKTNVMRLAASLKGLSDVKVGIVNCEEPGKFKVLLYLIPMYFVTTYVYYIFLFTHWHILHYCHRIGCTLLRQSATSRSTARTCCQSISHGE